MAGRLGSASGTTSGANEDIFNAIKSATKLTSTDNFTIKQIEIYTDVSTNLKINDSNPVYMANITAITLTNGETYNYKLSLGEDDVYIKELVIVASSPVKWAATLIY